MRRSTFQATSTSAWRRQEAPSGTKIRACIHLNIHVESVFETTIRFVGGLLSAYELSGEQHPILLTKAKEVADKLAFAWVGVRTLL